MLPEDVRILALMLPEAVAGAHSGNPDFRVGGRIFATLWVEEARVVLRLAPADQAARCEAEPDLFTPLDGAWGAGAGPISTSTLARKRPCGRRCWRRGGRPHRAELRAAYEPA